MDSLAHYLDEIKVLKDLEKDSDVARLLKVSRAHISQIRSGSHMGEVKCFELAIMLRREPLELLSLNQALRSRENKVEAYWRKIHASYAVK